MPTISAKNLAAALSLAKAGFRVFPARAIFNPATGRWNKPPCVSDWQTLATYDPGLICRWWKQFPDAIPAICCEDVVIIDADRHPGGPDGVAALAALAKRYGDWPDHPVVLTPSNGEHRYFKQPNPPLGNRTGQLPYGIDIRGAGGYGIGVGAVLPDGTGWRIAPGHSTDLPQLPPWLEQMVRADKIPPTNNNEIASQSSITRRELRYAEAALQTGIGDIETAPRGKRNTVLNSVAYRLGRMVGARWIQRNVVAVRLLSAAINLRNEDGETAVRTTINSGLTAGQREPHPDLPDRAW
jgi:Bifunctional DNA primase/polymerase, N-terminal